MFDNLTFERFAELAKQHHRLVVHREIAGDRLTPINSYLALNESAAADASLLESTPKGNPTDRYSYLYFNAITQVQARGHAVTVTRHNEHQQFNTDPFELLRDYKKQHHAHSDHPLAKTIGGMVGFLSYDAIRLIEDIPDRHHNDETPPDLLFRFYRDSITFDHRHDKVVIATIVTIDKEDLTALYRKTLSHIDDIAYHLFSYTPQPNQQRANTVTRPPDHLIETSMDDQDFCQMIEQAQQHIRRGDIFQVVLSREFYLRTNAQPIDIYRALRFTNPSPYMFFLTCDDLAIAGSSPEQLVRLDNGMLESSPLAGSRPRGRNAEEDEELAAELASDPKELAEHTMLVDLARNDIGALAVPGSVHLHTSRKIEKYARIMHIGSIVRGQLRDDFDALDVLKRTFPAGTLSGAPKIRAMELIDALESSRRGLYGGAICIIDNDGNLTSCIAIRMAVMKNGVACVRAGGGIVFDSDPQKEADESRYKASAILNGIILASTGGGL